MVPFSLTFGEHVFSEDTQNAISNVDYITKAIFVLDVIICFRKAYLDERTGLEVTNGKLIAKHYLKFYFWVDCSFRSES